MSKWLSFVFIAIIVLAIGTRFIAVTSFPPSLYWEEMALGYDAYSILKTGHDHLGNPPSIIAFESYGDYKPALYFYLLLPSLALFGLNEFAVRLPAMLAGVAIVIGVGLIARLLMADRGKQKMRLAQCLAMFVTTLSPWAIIFSRSAWEVNVATCLLVYGVVCCLWALQHQHRKLGFLELGLISFALSMYTYHAARLIAPFLALFLFCLIFFKDLRKRSLIIVSQYFVVGAVFLVFLSPLLFSLGDKAVQERLAETSIFADGHVVKTSNDYRQHANYVWWSKLLFHRDVFYVQEFAANYLKHFNLQFLFMSGDANLRHSVQYFGQMYIFEALFVGLGVIFVWRQKQAKFYFLFFWLVLGVVPAALTDAAPHALRTLPVMPVYMLLITFGVMELVALITRHSRLSTHLLLGSVVVVYAVFFTSFWRFYAQVYPKLYSGAWQYGYKQIVSEINRRKGQYKNVSFLREMDRPAMAYWFFSQTDPHLVQTIDKQLQKDQGAELQFENIHFINFVGEAQPGLVASTIWSLHQLQQKGSQVSNISEIKDPAGKPIWAIYELQ